MPEGKAKIYLDNAATTKVAEEVIEEMRPFNEHFFANPSAIHTEGIQVGIQIERAREKVAEKIHADQAEIFFTSGGTESNNLAILGTLKANRRRGKHIVTTQLEHPSVLQVVKQLEQEGYRVDYIGVDSTGRLDLERLRETVCEETVLVSIMHVNNEIGVINDIDEIGKIIKRKNKDTLFHVDAVQSFCKYEIDVQKAQIDLLSTSAHKIHGFKGTGALYCRKQVKISALFYGGSQQNGLRPGTENVYGILGFVSAMNRMTKEEKERVMRLKCILASRILAEIPDAAVNGPVPEEGAYHILNLRFKGVKAQILINALSGDGISVSAGAACSSRLKVDNQVLSALSLGRVEIGESIRVSLSRYNTEEELEYVVERLKIQIQQIRKLEY